MHPRIRALDYLEQDYKEYAGIPGSLLRFCIRVMYLHTLRGPDSSKGRSDALDTEVLYTFPVEETNEPPRYASRFAYSMVEMLRLSLARMEGPVFKFGCKKNR